MRSTALRGALFCVSVFVGTLVGLTELKSPIHLWLMATFKAYIGAINMPPNLAVVLVPLAIGGLFVAIPGAIAYLAGWLCWRLLGRYVLKTAAENGETK